MTDWDWVIPAEAAEGLIKFDLLPRLAEFRPAGVTSGPSGPIPLFEHTCIRPAGACAYISAAPSADDDPYVVPGCRCRPREVSGG